jgi:hypothetical protein
MKFENVLALFRIIVQVLVIILLFLFLAAGIMLMQMIVGGHSKVHL